MQDAASLSRFTSAVSWSLANQRCEMAVVKCWPFLNAVPWAGGAQCLGLSAARHAAVLAHRRARRHLGMQVGEQCGSSVTKGVRMPKKAKLL